jgi:hypothetical protein
MSAMATPTTAPERSSGASQATRPRFPRPLAAPPETNVNPHHRGGTILFEVPFTSAMSDDDLSVLANALDLWRHMQPKMRPSPTSLGVARLDHFSGLFLERDGDDGHWVLHARTWGQPAPQTVHDWHLVAAQAARQLDPSVRLPGPISKLASQPGLPEHARIVRRRLTRRPKGLS